MSRIRIQCVLGLIIWAVAIGAFSAPAAALECDQTARFPRPIPLGISGGGNNTKVADGEIFCAGGTLGSMVQDGSGVQYILSNNHVLANENKGAIGAQILQPGLEENPCVRDPSNRVAELSEFVRLKFGSGGENTVDAAIAKVIPGKASPTILNIGAISATIVSSPAAALGSTVQKMGRTTCLQQDTVTAVGVDIVISYAVLGSTVSKKANFTNQIIITGANFSAAGDSGSLVLSTDPCPQPVGLLFAGGNGTTIANPIADVLTDLNVQFVGTCSSSVVSPIVDNTAAADNVATQWAGTPAVANAAAIRDANRARLMKIPGAIGTGIGLGDAPGQTLIEVYVKELTPAAQAAAPTAAGGIPVRLKETGEISAY